MDSGRNPRPGFAAIPVLDPKLALDVSLEPSLVSRFPASRSPWECSGCWGRALPGTSRCGAAPTSEGGVDMAAIPRRSAGIGDPAFSNPNRSSVLGNASPECWFCWELPGAPRILERIPRDPTPGPARTIPHPQILQILPGALSSCSLSSGAVTASLGILLQRFPFPKIRPGVTSGMG